MDAFYTCITSKYQQTGRYDWNASFRMFEQIKIDTRRWFRVASSCGMQDVVWCTFPPSKYTKYCARATWVWTRAAASTEMGCVLISKSRCLKKNKTFKTIDIKFLDVQESGHTPEYVCMCGCSQFWERKGGATMRNNGCSSRQPSR